MSLANLVTTGKKIKPLALLVYGVHGVGKSTFGEECPAPIFIGSEENDELESARLPIVKTWAELREQLSMLLKEKHDYRTVVIDTIDKLEEIAQGAILSGKDSNKTMATAMGGFGKAYQKMADMFREIRDNFLIPLRDQKGMNIVILAHSKKGKDNDPITAMDYVTYETAMHEKVKPVFQDWVSGIFFITYERFKSSNDNGTDYVIGEGDRILYTEERPSHVGKNRFNLDYEFDFVKGETFVNISAQIKTFYAGAKKAVNAPSPVKEVATEIIHDIKKNTAREVPIVNDEANELKFQVDALYEKLDEDMKAKLKTSVARAGNDVKKLQTTKRKIEAMLR